MFKVAVIGQSQVERDVNMRGPLLMYKNTESLGYVRKKLVGSETP